VRTYFSGLYDAYGLSGVTASHENKHDCHVGDSVRRHSWSMANSLSNGGIINTQPVHNDTTTNNSTSFG
jgi:hypothetical protein